MIANPRDFQRKLIQWYDRNRRDLPWRTALGSSHQTLPDAYHVLLSETMLQQTQVATVIPYFHRFLEKFPTLRHLAQADLQEVLRLWQGLGYYSRARNLHACVKQIVDRHDARVPESLEHLLALPGIGRYTAGAIASLAFGVRAPILDGNVTRVICRLDAIESDPRDKSTLAQLWHRAEELLPKTRVADFNSALMELGATVCTPRNPQCLICPVKSHCAALAANRVDVIPKPKKVKPTPLFRRRVFCIAHDGKFLIEQRPAKGRWAGLWQFPTYENAEAPVDSKWVFSQSGLKVSKLIHLGQVRHALTHRRYEFEAYACELAQAPESGQTWTTIAGLIAYPLSKPQLEIAVLLKTGQEGR